jgi:hypothetical protein
MKSMLMVTTVFVTLSYVPVSADEFAKRKIGMLLSEYRICGSMAAERTALLTSTFDTDTAVSQALASCKDHEKKLKRGWHKWLPDPAAVAGMEAQFERSKAHLREGTRQLVLGARLPRVSEQTGF